MRKIILLFVLAFFKLNCLAQGKMDSVPQPFAVVELFTSEGCSSCPPAEKLLSKLVTEAGTSGRRIFPLEFHVDYWNKYGWKDPYSSLQYSKRQKRYVDLSAEREMYTPQMIVNGKTTFVGSEVKKANQEIDSALAEQPKLVFQISKDKNSTNDTLVINYQASKLNTNYFLNFAIVERGIEIKVGKGENGGKTLRHDNVVRYFTSIELADKNSSVKLPLNQLKKKKNLSVIAFIQNKQNYFILAADQLELMDQ